MTSLLAIQWFVPNSMIETMGWVLMHTLWQFLLVALIVGVLARVLRKTSSSTRYLVLVFAFGLAIASPVVTWYLLKGVALAVNSVPAPVANLEVPLTSVLFPGFSPEGNGEEQGKPVNTENSRDLPGEWVLQKNQWSQESSLSFAEQMKITLKPWLGWIVGFWMVGVFFGSFRPLLGWWTLWRLRRIGVSPVSREIEVAARRISSHLGLRCIVEIFQSSLASVPVVVGYLRPMVLFPVSLLAELPVTQLEAILAHELAHIRRHDFVVNLLQTFVETLFFYHPAIWWLSHQIRIEREHCCDDLVIRLFDNRVDYGRALVAIEQKRGQSALLALGANDGSMLSRVKRILGHGHQGASPKTWSYPTAWSYLGGFLAALSMLVFLNLFSLNSHAETRAGESGQEAAASQPLPGGSPPLPGGPILTKEISLDLKLEPGQDKGWIFIDLDDVKIRKPDFPVDGSLNPFPQLGLKPEELRFKNWLVDNQISLILQVERTPFEDGSGKTRYRVQTRSIRTSLKTINGFLKVPHIEGDSWQWNDPPEKIVEPFLRKDDATLVSGFVTNSSSAREIKPDSPDLRLFRTCANMLGFYLLERNDFKRDGLSLNIVRVANVSQPLQDLDFDGTFVSGKDGAPDPSGLDKPIRGNLQPPWVVASKTGSWLLSNGASLKISSQSVPSADELIMARITWPGEGINPDPKKSITIAADAFGNRVKWAVGFEKDQPFLWIATCETGKNLYLKKLRIEKGKENTVEEIIRKVGEPIDGLGIPDQIAREMEKVLGWIRTAKSEVVRPNDLAPGMVNVMGRIVDEETGAPINLIAIQSGTASDKDPSKVTWGYGFSYGVTLQDGKFDQVLNWAHNERRRILAPGYEPASILEELSNSLPSNQIVERTIRLKKGRMVKGVLKDHEGKPVAKGKVFFIPETHRANILRGIPGLEGLRGGISQNQAMDYSVSQAVTDSSGGFEIRSGGNGILAASTESVDLWPFPLPETDRVPDLILPQPGQLKIDLSYGYLDEFAKKGKEVIGPDSESPNQWYLTLYRLDQNDPLWKKCTYSGMLAVFMKNQPAAISKGVKIGEIRESTKTGSFEINSAGWVNKTLATSITVDLPPGVYQLFRHRPGERSPQQETVEIKPGGTARLDWTRPEGAAIFGSVALPPRSQFVRQPGEAPVPLTWSIPHGNVLIATREGKTMEVAKIHKDGGFFVPRHLPPGKYKASAWAWLPESDRSRQFNLIRFIPGLTGEKEFEIPAGPEIADGAKWDPKQGLPPVRLELTMESRSNQIVSVPLENPPAEEVSSLVKPRPLNDQEIEKRVLATLRKPFVDDPAKGSWQGGAFEAEILMNLVGIQPRDQVVKTLLKVIDGTETSSQDQKRLALLHLSGAIPKELVPRLIQTLKLWETKPFNPRDRIGPRVEIEMLGRMGQDASEAIPVLIKLLDLPDWNVRADAIQALVKIGPRSSVVIQAIFERLDDAETVYQAARFGELGKPHAAKLVPLLESKNAGICTWAGWGLVTTGYDRDRGLEFLIGQVATGSPEEKKLAATALAALGNQSRPVLEKLRMLEKGTSPDVAKEIQDAVKRIEKDDRILTHAQEADKVVAGRIASREALQRIHETNPQPLIGKGTIEKINNSGFLLAEGIILTTNDATTYFQMFEAKEVAIARKDVKVGSTIQWEGVPGRAITKVTLPEPNSQLATPAKPMTGRGVEEKPNPGNLKTIPGTEIGKPQPTNPRPDTPRQIGSLTGQFVLDGKAPTPKDLYPGFSRIDPNGPQLPGAGGRFSGVEMIYREFLKKGIRPRTENASLLIGPKGGIANILVWAVKKEMPLPDFKPDPKPVIIRLRDGNFSPRLTIVPVGQSLRVENQDPVSFQIRLFSNVNPEFNQLLRPNQEDWGTTWKPTQAESLPLRYRSDVGPWADGWIVVPATPFVAISGLDGSFSIPNLPVGEWEFRGWHERMGFLKIWPSGKIKQKIDPGHNSLGSMKIRAEWFEDGSPPKAPEASYRNSQPEFGSVPDSSPNKGLEFLKPYPNLHGLSLDMTEEKFLEIAKQKKLKLRKETSGDRIHYLLGTGDGHTVIVMFAGVGEKCSGIQRIRGEEKDPPAPEEKPETSPPSVSKDNPLERKISGNLRNLSLQEGLNTISKTANVTLQLDQAGLKETGLDLKKSISVDFAYVPLSTALGRVINWEKHPGLMYEMRGNKLVITTLAEYQKHIESHLPDWLKVHYNKGLLAKMDADHQVISITTSGIVTDELLSKFASLPRLKELYIEATRQISPGGLKHLAKMASLETLALHGLQYEEKGLGDSVIPQLVGLKALRELTMANCGLTDAGARSLENLNPLTLLSLTNEGKLTDEALVSISQLQKLKSLNLSSNGNLTRQISPLTEAGLKKLTVLEGLEELHLVGHPVTGEVLKFPKLKTLNLGFSSVGDDCAQRIATFQDLRSLQLLFTGITDNGLKQIAGLPGLIQLNLDSSVITDQGIDSLRKSKTLSHLSLRASQLTDRSLGYVAQIPSLTRIDLNGSGEPGFRPGKCFTIAGVEQLKILPQLRTLWLTNFQSPGGYMGLKDFTQLHELTFLMVDIRQTDVEALEEALPNTRIHAATGGGFVSPKINSKKNPK